MQGPNFLIEPIKRVIILSSGDGRREVSEPASYKNGAKESLQSLILSQTLKSQSGILLS